MVGADTGSSGDGVAGSRPAGLRRLFPRTPSSPRRAVISIALMAWQIGFTVAYTAQAVAEVYGPATDQAGRIMDTDRQVSVSHGRYGADRTTISNTVIGERVDGSVWIIKGEKPFNFAGARYDENLTIRTSSLTGRVVALIADDGAWHARESGLVWSAVFFQGALLLVLGSAWLAYRLHPTSSWYHPLPRRRWLPSGGAGLFVGALGMITVLNYDTWTVEERPTIAGSLREIAARPYDVDLGEDIAVVAPDNLAPEAGRQYEVLSAQSLAVMVVLEYNAQIWSEFWLVGADGPDVASIDCPVELAYPEYIDPVHRAGFVCFPSASAGTTLEVRQRLGDVLVGADQIDLPGATG